MSLLFVQSSISVDGLIEDANGVLAWFTEDKSVEAFLTQTLRAIDRMVLGRAAHTWFADFWKNAVEQDARNVPDPEALCNMLDLTPGGRSTDWYQKLEYS